MYSNRHFGECFISKSSSNKRFDSTFLPLPLERIPLGENQKFKYSCMEITYLYTKSRNCEMKEL